MYRYIIIVLLVASMVLTAIILGSANRESPESTVGSFVGEGSGGLSELGANAYMVSKGHTFITHPLVKASLSSETPPTVTFDGNTRLKDISQQYVDFLETEHAIAALKGGERDAGKVLRADALKKGYTDKPRTRNFSNDI